MAKKIMCVDDSPTIRELIRNSLAGKDFEIVEAENGQIGLDTLTRDVALFLVDVNMPVMNGFEFVENLKKTPGYEQKPVVFLTTESAAEKKAKGKELGVNGWIVKPFERESLIKIVEMLVD